MHEAEPATVRAIRRDADLMFVVCGEALYDLFGAGDGTGTDVHFDGRMGGSPFNVARGMARLGANVALFTGVSTDMLGENLFGTLRDEGVDTRYLMRTGRRTTLSVVAVDATGGPSYTFYGVGSSDCTIHVTDLPHLGDEVTGLHFGSYSIAVEPVATAMAALARRERHRFISLDPNVRPTVEPDMRIWRERIEAMRRCASIVKVSDEDLAALYPGVDPEETLKQWASGGHALTILTRGGNEVLALRGSDTIRVSPPTITVVDTVGAGDAFQASTLSSICQNAEPREWLQSASKDALHSLLDQASRAAAMVCQRRGAALPSAQDLHAGATA
jgi:fructokinase